MQKTILKIEGMACSMCEAHINDCLRQNFNVKKVSAKYKSGECVIISDFPLNCEELKNTVNKTGYTVISVIQTEYEKKAHLLFNK